jgi:hypothetical protein
LKRCADEIASVDVSMQTLRDLIMNDQWNCPPLEQTKGTGCWCRPGLADRAKAALQAL